jgi:hypothetical protein
MASIVDARAPLLFTHGWLATRAIDQSAMHVFHSTDHLNLNLGRSSESLTEARDHPHASTYTIVFQLYIIFTQHHCFGAYLYS